MADPELAGMPFPQYIHAAYQETIEIANFAASTENAATSERAAGIRRLIA